jgi:hypothetical protein
VGSSSHLERILLLERSNLFESHWSNQWLTYSVNLGLAVSPDERTILYAQIDHVSSELMLVDKFR